jgi:PHS family inorganic phosphate transporter-like MFS transporter
MTAVHDITDMDYVNRQPHTELPTDSHAGSSSYDTTNNSNSGLTKLQELTNDTFSRMNNSKLTWWHAKAVLIAGTGFMCDGYNLNVIGLVSDQIARIYYPDWTYWSPAQCTAHAQGLYSLNNLPVTTTSTGASTVCGSHYSKIANYPANERTYHVPGAMPQSINYAISAVALCGLVVGQLLFGYLGDNLGRKKMFVLTMVGMTVFAFLSGLTVGSGTRAVIFSICFFRFVLGVFIGGDYPLSGVLISEFSNTKNRGLLVLLVFSCQGVGYAMSEAFVSIMAAIWAHTLANPDYLWRVCLMFGLFPALVSLYARVQMPESPRYRLYNELNTQGMLTDMEAVFEREGVLTAEARTNLARELASSSTVTTQRTEFQSYTWFLKNYGLILIGTAGSWMMQDVAFYSKVLFGLSGVIGPQLNLLASDHTSVTGATFMLQNAAVECYINLASIYPGYFVAAFLVDYKWMGRWRMQQLGFFVMALVAAILAGMFTQLKTNIAPFFVLYALNGFFNNVGPNATTYLIPAEVFPSEWRSTGHGISAASGKVGAIAGTFGFSYMVAAPGIGYPGAFGLLAGTAFVGLLVTFLIPETNGKTLEDLGRDGVVLQSISPDLVVQKQLQQYGTSDYYSNEKLRGLNGKQLNDRSPDNEERSYV